MKNKILMIMLCLSIVIGSMGEITYAACSVDAVKGNGRNVNVNSFSIDETVIDEDASSREEKSDSAQNSSDEDEDLQGDYQESDMEDDDSEENKSSYGGTVQNSDIESDEDVSESTENDDSTSEIAREDLQEEPQGDLEFGNEDKNLNDSGQSGNSDFDSADASRSATEAQAAPDESEEGTGTHSVDDNLDAEIEFTEEAELYNDASGSFTYIVSGKNITITGYSGAGGVLAIPAKLDNYTVTAIGNEAFKNYTAITEIDIPGSVL